jgi:hypothetical protein
MPHLYLRYSVAPGAVLLYPIVETPGDTFLRFLGVLWDLIEQIIMSLEVLRVQLRRLFTRLLLQD